MISVCMEFHQIFFYFFFSLLSYATFNNYENTIENKISNVNYHLLLRIGSDLVACMIEDILAYTDSLSWWFLDDTLEFLHVDKGRS